MNGNHPKRAPKNPWFTRCTVTLGSMACVVIGVAACGRSNKEPATPQTTSATIEPGGAGGNATGQSSKMSDGQIVEMVNELNSAEVDQGRYAIDHAADARVKRFAQHMVDAHTDANQKMLQIARAQNLALSGSSESKQLVSDAKDTFESLKGEQGNDFDRAYLDAQIKEHKNALDQFDTVFLGDTRSGDLRALFQNMRPQIQEHLSEAEVLRRSLH